MYTYMYIYIYIGRRNGYNEESTDVSTVLRSTLYYLALLEFVKRCGNLAKILGPGFVMGLTSSHCGGLFKESEADKEALFPLSCGGTSRCFLLALDSTTGPPIMYLFLHAWPIMACMSQLCQSFAHSHLHLREVVLLRQLMFPHKIAAHLGALKRHIFLTSLSLSLYIYIYIYIYMYYIYRIHI